MFPRKLIPAALSIWVGFAGGVSRGQEGPAATANSPMAIQEPGQLPLIPAPAPAVAAAPSNQQMADTIAERLHKSGRLQGYRIDIRFADGAAELSGRVADAAQRLEVVRIVEAIPGVTSVRDLIEVAAGGMVQTAQEAAPSQEQVPGSLMSQVRPPVGMEVKGIFGHHGPSYMQEPMSIMDHTANPGPTDMQPPMPPYAWPTCAPYDNYSRVAYPNAYPSKAFPFIGPIHPFPKVPLGWRGVSLTWEDGFWWYGRKATGHDWWRIRYY